MFTDGRLDAVDADVRVASLRRLMEVDVAEIYSPPRVTEEAAKHRLVPGEALDLSTGWNFSFETDRQAAWSSTGTHRKSHVHHVQPVSEFDELDRS